MKRKKWSEHEEQTLLNKYADLQTSGTLSKLKTREKKFKPIADHVNSIHHLHDPITYPFTWSWRDVSIKVQNMRHQYLGVKQKIRVSDDEFNWDDGENHWDNFLRYKEVFGDVELEGNRENVNGGVKRVCCNSNNGGGDFSSNVEEFLDDDDLGLGFEIDYDGFDEDEDVGQEEDDDDIDDGADDEGEDGFCGGSSSNARKLKRKRIALLGARVLELRDVLVKREERRKERDFCREESLMLKEEGMREIEGLKEKRAREEDERVEERELEESQMRWSRREFDRQLRMERELEEERRWRRKMEEKREEEEMEWRERMTSLQLDHEKQMMQMHADACQNQMQILGVMARLMCQFFGSANDGLGGALGGLHPQVLQNLQHPGPGDLGDDSKPGSDSPPEFL